MKILKKIKCENIITFTLVELLIVAAITIILMSLLMPALRKAKELSKSISCSNNLKNISLGFAMYANNWDGYFIPYNYSDHTHTFWPFGIDEYLEGKAQSGYYFSYKKGFGSSMAWYCPSRPENNTSRSDYIDYAYNIYLGGYTGVYRKIHNISLSSKTELCLDSKYPNESYKIGISYLIKNSDDRIHARHNNMFNTVFVDGHAKSLKLDSIPTSVSTNLIEGTW